MSWYTQWESERTAAESERQRNEIQRQLDAIDRQSIRPQRAVSAGTDTQPDRDRLSELESEAATLRDQLAAIPELDA